MLWDHLGADLVVVRDLDRKNHRVYDRVRFGP